AGAAASAAPLTLTTAAESATTRSARTRFGARTLPSTGAITKSGATRSGTSRTSATQAGSTRRTMGGGVRLQGARLGDRRGRESEQLPQHPRPEHHDGDEDRDDLWHEG